MSANMNFLFLTRILTLSGVIAVLAGQSALAGEVTVEDNQLRVAFDENSGALTRLEYLSTHWIIERRPELGISFRLHAPLPDRRDNFVLGQKQRAAEVKKLSDHQVRIQWRNPISEHGGVLPMTLTATVTLKGGALTFDATIENHSPLMVETIDYPYLGDLNPPTQSTPLQASRPDYGDLRSTSLYPDFSNDKGYWGVDFPTKAIGTGGSLFCLIQAPHQGLYLEMADPTLPYLLEWTFEQHPGLIDSINNTVPKGDEISGISVYMEFRACHFIFAHPNSTAKLAPVVLRCYKGDWHAGVDLYKEWRATWIKPPHVPDWIKDVNSWQQLQINSPEQNYRVAYADLIKYGEECASNGVRAIQLVGWNHGGQDGGDPAQNTDPGLGTWQELHDAIAQIQAKGVKIILFAKLNWADKTTDWFNKELYKYAATDPYGIPYEQGGYSYVTPTQLSGINNHRRAVMDVDCPAYRDIATKEFGKVLALGSEGWLWDEVQHHGPVEYSFAPDHGYTPPGYIYAGDMPLARELRAAADKVNPNFLFSGEAPQDWLMQYYPCSYFRIGGSSVPVYRYIDPKAPLMVAVTGFDDREMLNLILLDRYIISYEPYNFKGHLTDFPLTLAYGRKIDALRRRYKDYLWDADFRDTLGANVMANGSCRYSVFVTVTGKRAVVVINPDSRKSMTAQVKMPHSGNLVVATPETPDARPTSGTLEIPARSAAVVMEQ